LRSSPCLGRWRSSSPSFSSSRLFSRRLTDIAALSYLLCTAQRVARCQKSGARP
jgi:hypothetical protein